MTINKVIFKMLANIYLSRKFINTNFVTILMPLNRTRHNCDKFLWYKSCVLRINIYIYIYIYIYESICIQKKCPLRCQYFTHLAAEVLHTITPTSQLYIYICVAVNIYIDFAPFPLLPTNQQPNVSANLLLLRCH